MIGENTHGSKKWIPWEITLAVEEKKDIIAMRFKDSPSALTPKVLIDNNILPFNWDIDKLFGKIRNY